MHITMTGLAGVLGARHVTLDELADRFGLSPEKITAKTGVTGLRRLADDQSLVAVGAALVRRVLEQSGITPDAVFGSSNPTAETLLPTFTASVAAAAGLHDVIVDHVGLGCCGGLQALRNAYNQLVVDALDGRTSHCLVVVGDQTSRILDPEHRQTGTLFSEGVAVAVLTNSDQVTNGYRITAVRTKSLLGEALEALRLPNPLAGHPGFLQMDGGRIFEFGAGIFSHFVELIGGALPPDCYVVPHQSNLRMLEAMAERAGLDSARVYVDGIRTIGNTSPAATLFGLEDALRRGLVGLQEPVLLGAFGAELQVGAALLHPIGNPAALLA